MVIVGKAKWGEGNREGVCVCVLKLDHKAGLFSTNEKMQNLDLARFLCITLFHSVGLGTWVFLSNVCSVQRMTCTCHRFYHVI